MPENFLEELCRNYERMERAIQFMADNFKARPGLDEIADHAGLSKFHFNRVFRRWAGISPGRFIQFLSLEYAKQKLAQSQSLLDAALETGLSGPGRLHDLFVSMEAMTPGEYKQGGTGLAISYGFSPSPFGLCLAAQTPRGICQLGFTHAEGRDQALEALQASWPGASLSQDQIRADKLVQSIFDPGRAWSAQPFHLHLKGTNFQVKVWKALLSIPEGSLLNYQSLAAFLGKPQACRAVAGAVAANPVAYLIPCHRVIAKTGKIHQYRWGAARKKALVAWEAARVDPNRPEGGAEPSP